MACMSDIWSLQRAARVHEVRDTAHFQLLRVRELLRGRGRQVRTAGGIVVGAALLMTVLTIGVGAEEDDPARPAAAPAPAQRTGTARAETLAGGSGVDHIDGGAGPDVLLGNASADRLVGGPGDDVVQGGGGKDVLWAGAGRDVLIGGAGDDQLHAESFDGSVDRLHCGEGDDTAWIVSVNGRTVDQVFGCEHINVTTMRSAPAKR
ncbi:MAG: Hemolysin-type calcium-binding region [Thermoleophilia bacterium]|nr:Hemolysin-type calcium-binding region [Thermoleophilia bacterium]